jgi:hypothetical protein
MRCRVGSLLVFADRAAAEAHLEVLEAAAVAEAACELMIPYVAGMAPEVTSGQRSLGLAPDCDTKVGRQIAALNVAVYRLDMAPPRRRPHRGWRSENTFQSLP